MRLAVIGAAIAGAVVAASSALAGTTTVIAVADDEFTPDAVVIPVTLGPVSWRWDDAVVDEHNVRQDSKLFYSGEPTSTTTTQYTISASAGTYHYYCEVHGSRSGGMDGKLRVRPEFYPAPGKRGPAIVFGVRWATGTGTGDQWDVKYKGRGSGGKYVTWLKNTEDLSAVFGEGGEPVAPQAGDVFRFKARTERSSNPDRHSGFSPVAKAGPVAPPG